MACKRPTADSDTGPEGCRSWGLALECSAQPPSRQELDESPAAAEDARCEALEAPNPLPHAAPGAQHILSAGVKQICEAKAINPVASVALVPGALHLKETLKESKREPFLSPGMV